MRLPYRLISEMCCWGCLEGKKDEFPNILPKIDSKDYSSFNFSMLTRLTGLFLIFLATIEHPISITLAILMASLPEFING
jgi:hypothetical protein